MWRGGRTKGGHRGEGWLPLIPSLPTDAPPPLKEEGALGEEDCSKTLKPSPPERYLPDSKLPDNIEAMADLETVVDGADVLIMCAPHQFVRGICKQLQASGKVGDGGCLHCGYDGRHGVGMAALTGLGQGG